MLNFLKNRIPLTMPSGQKLLKVGRTFGVPYEDYVSTGERDAILASSGMGKSYLTGVLMEETLENDGVLCIIDPEGEHFTLAERYPMMIIGGEHANLPLEEEAIDLYLQAMLQQGISTVFDLSEYVDDEQQQIYSRVVDALFNAQQQYRRKVRLVVEEAQIYAPQRGTGGRKKISDTPDCVTVSQKIAKRGRKRAIDSLWATQRPASINKDILSQCNRFWFGGISSEQDYKAIKPFLTEAGISFGEIKALKPGQFYFHGKCNGETITKLVQVRKRLCKHGGATPEAGKAVSFKATSDRPLEKAIAGLAEEVARMSYEQARERNEADRLKQSISQLEEENRRLSKELAEERLATKVIDRLGGGGGSSVSTVGGGSGRPRRRSTSAAVAAAAAGLRTVNGYDALDDSAPEKIYLD